MYKLELYWGYKKKGKRSSEIRGNFKEKIQYT